MKLFLRKLFRKRLMHTMLVFICIVASLKVARAATVVFVSETTAPSNTFTVLNIAAQFYGLELHPITLAGGGSKVLFAALHDQSVVAIVITVEALPSINKNEFFRENSRHIPLLIVGIKEKTSSVVLSSWSSGTISACRHLSAETKSSLAMTERAEDITRQLGGVELPLVQREISYLSMSGGISLMNVKLNGSSFPVFSLSNRDGQEVFFASELAPVDVPATPDPYRQQALFATMASQMVFLHFAGGDRIWHSPGDYANLTIDDIWLREPYGHVNYKGLLEQAQKHNFHVTAAFIPWNFDRSQAGTVSLFQSYPEKFSICVHGNNHIHQEFGSLDSHPLTKQVADIKQGLARMEQFKRLTQIPYDAVMVFPHSISPEATLSELKRYNFLATANSLNVPSDVQAPGDPEFALRTATLKFANFPSMRRYSAETNIPEPQLAIDAFLGNPMLFYVHESFFATGMGAFNPVADTVNRIQPDTQWRSLGYIVRHLYLEKLRDDGNYDVRVYSASVELSNSSSRDATYFVEKDEDFALPITVLVDGKPYSFQRSGAKLTIVLPIGKGLSRDITIKYGNDLNLAAVDISKSSFRTNSIRMLSDFRDDTVSRTMLGRYFIRSYAENGSVWNRGVAILMCLIIVGLLYRRLRNRKGISPPRLPYADGQSR